MKLVKTKSENQVVQTNWLTSRYFQRTNYEQLYENNTKYVNDDYSPEKF